MFVTLTWYISGTRFVRTGRQQFDLLAGERHCDGQLLQGQHRKLGDLVR
jgi:hypothetical protein